MPLVIVRATGSAGTTHLQESVDPVTTYCGAVLKEKTVVRERFGYVSCVPCVDANLMARGKSRGGREDPLIPDDQ